MPHAELKYSADLKFDADAVFDAIEKTIGAHDAGAGECKCRAYPSEQTNYTHLMVSVVMLRKPHRDAAFLDGLLRDLEAAIKAQLTQSCRFSLGIEFSGDAYVTGVFETPQQK